jgi:hypothetical protein
VHTAQSLGKVGDSFVAIMSHHYYQNPEKLCIFMVRNRFVHLDYYLEFATFYKYSPNAIFLSLNSMTIKKTVLYAYRLVPIFEKSASTLTGNHPTTSSILKHAASSIPSQSSPSLVNSQSTFSLILNLSAFIFIPIQSSASLIFNYSVFSDLQPITSFLILIQSAHADSLALSK